MGALYFLNKNEVTESVKSAIVEHKSAPKPSVDNHIATIDHITKENIQKEKIRNIL